MILLSIKRSVRSLCAITSCFFIPIHIYAETNLSAQEENIFFNLSKMNIKTYGLYSPKKDGPMTGLKAESVARKSGINMLSVYFKHSCEGVDPKIVSLKSGWENYFRSQGSEIFANGYLKICLQARFNQVIKASPSHKKSIKTKDNEKIYFKLPDNVPGKAVHCGAMVMAINNSLSFHIVPTEVLAEDSDINIVELSYNPQKEVLQPKTPKDEETLLKSSLVKESISGDSILPMTVLISE